MNIDHYRRQAAAVLDAHRTQIKDRLAVCFLNIPASATSATVGIHVDPEGEGFLTLRLHLEGLDLYVLNRALGDHAELFSTTMSEDGLQPPLPLMRPGHESFQVSDALSDCALAWLRTQWAELAPADIAIPVRAEAMEDHGDRESVILQR